jgi:hypothetical protein
MKKISWFSCGAASAIATKLSNPDFIIYSETGSEDEDNERFLNDCEQWFGKAILRLKNTKFADTWDLWEKKKYLAGNDGAPCTGALKVEPRLYLNYMAYINVFGYTADKSDVRRAENFKENWPEMATEMVLIEQGMNKSACLQMLKNAGIKPPRVYELGFHNANCIPCCKATSPAYWALVRKEYPVQFERMTELSRRLGARLTRINDERIFIDEIPINHETTNPIQPECDFLCHLAELGL